MEIVARIGEWGQKGHRASAEAATVKAALA